jgi:hypothetical protein
MRRSWLAAKAKGVSEVPRKDSEEISAVIEHLQSSGEYGRFASARADREADAMGELLAAASELTDEAVMLLLGSVPGTPTVPEAQLETEVARVIQRAAPAGWRVSALEALRAQRGFTIGQVVDALLERLQLPTKGRRKLRRYYEELEAGLIPMNGVSRRLWVALSELFQAPTDEVVLARYAFSFDSAQRAYWSHWPSQPPRRRAVRRSPMTSAEPDSPEWDEIDALFRSTV